MIGLWIINVDFFRFSLALPIFLLWDPVLLDQKVVEFPGLVDVDSEHFLCGRFTEIPDRMMKIVEERVTGVEKESWTDSKKGTGKVFLF